MSSRIIYSLISAERTRQKEKWGGAHSWGYGDCSSASVADTTKLAVLVEEVGEVGRALLEGDRQAMFEELVQVAAVSVAWLEGLLE